ncbi:hypothetical protein [Staphylococcus phage LY01]|nr:hypothetical protein [Staphylococcus phage LY01]
MANLSDASGTILFEGFEGKEKFLKEMKKLMVKSFSEKETQYFINFHHDIDENGQIIVGNELEEQFNAIGRWSFGSSLEKFFDNISTDIVELYKHEENSEELIKDNLDYIKNNFAEDEDMSIRFEFIDYEPGMDFLLEGFVEVRPGNIIKDDHGFIKYMQTEISSDFTDLEVNVENLISEQIMDSEDFILPEQINFIDSEYLPEEDDLDIEVDENHKKIRRELLRRYTEENSIFCIRENRMMELN